jgi:hypothetical protein
MKSSVVREYLAGTVQQWLPQGSLSDGAFGEDRERRSTSASQNEAGQGLRRWEEVG